VRQRWTERQRHHSAQHHHRASDADLDPRQRHAAQSKRRADRHHRRERQRQEPQRASAKLRGPEANRHHREHMVEAAERMQQPFGETHVRMVAHMRERRGAEACSGSGGE